MKKVFHAYLAYTFDDEPFRRVYECDVVALNADIAKTRVAQAMFAEHPEYRGHANFFHAIHAYEKGHIYV